MAVSLSTLTATLSSLSFSSNISQTPTNTLSFARTKPLSHSHVPKFPSLTVTATTLTAPVEPEIEDLKKYVKSRLPGGFAAQPITGTGRRKSAVARVVLKEGTGKFVINYRDAKEYLQENRVWLLYARLPLRTLGYGKSYDVFVKAEGGGLSGQAQAITLGIARALLKVSENHRVPLRQRGLLTRDSRVVERKKPGLHKARKAPQYSKR